MEAKTKNDQLVRETFQKLAQVILQSRVVFPPTPQHKKTINKWFNLEIEELEIITHDMVSWNNIQAPLFVELHFPLPEPLPHPDYSPLMERWKITYQASAGGPAAVELPQAYKYLVLLIRSVSGLLRVLPSFHPFRNSQKSSSSSSYSSYSSYSSSPFSSPFSPSSSLPGIGYSFHSSFPSSREFSLSRPTQEFTFDTVTLPFGSISVSVVYRTDCSVEIGATESIMNVHVIKDYSPTDFRPPIHHQQQQQQQQIQQQYQQQQQQQQHNQYQYPHHLQHHHYHPPQDSSSYRTAPIGIPGKDRPETTMPIVLSPPSSLTLGPGYTPPSQNPNSTPNPNPNLNSIPIPNSNLNPNQGSYPPPSSQNFLRQNSLPTAMYSNNVNSNYTPSYLSSSPLGNPVPMNIPGSYNNNSNRYIPSAAFSSSPMGTDSSGGSTGTINSSGSNNNFNSSGGNNNNSNSNSNNNNNNIILSGGSSGGSAKLRPRAASYAPPSSVPISIINPPIFSSSNKPPLMPRENYGTSPSSQSLSPSSQSLSPVSSSPNNLTIRPATNMYMSSLLGPSIHLTSPTAQLFDMNSFTPFADEELAFVGDKVQEEIGEFIRMCKNAPALNKFSTSEESSRVVGTSFLFADNMTMSQVANKLVSFSLTDQQ